LAQWNAVYDAHNEVACLTLGSMTHVLQRQFENSSPYEMLQELKSMFEKQVGVERFDLIQTFHACKQEEGKPVDPYVIKMKNYVANYNKHNLGKTIGELHALLIEYEKGLPKKAVTRQVMVIQGGRIQKANKKSLNAIGKVMTLKALRSDRGDEYISQEFKDYLKACGIVQQLTPPYTPQLSGVSEMRNRTLLDIVRSMMNLITLSLSFWDYALDSAACILNMVPTKKVDKTSYELWYGKVLNLSYLKVWGCEALVKQDMPDKLQQISVKCIFIGYPKETMGFYFYFPPENKIVVARYAEFLEKNLISQEVS
ncbi:retrotransposon protein, putative, ty1-copia subclass, partial [Tanacetum coccineum]